MNDNIVTKSVVSVTDMAHMVGLSRARFYQLVKRGTFPSADHDELTKRPCYGEDKQRQILEARRRNCGVDGKPILFYCRRNDAGQKRPTSRPAKSKVKSNQHTDLIDGLEQLGLKTSSAQVEPLLKELFPGGTDGLPPGDIIRAVFLRIRRQNSDDSVGR